MCFRQLIDESKSPAPATLDKQESKSYNYESWFLLWEYKYFVYSWRDKPTTIIGHSQHPRNQETIHCFKLVC